jgi:hypothetical protein
MIPITFHSAGSSRSIFPLPQLIATVCFISPPI